MTRSSKVKILTARLPAELYDKLAQAGEGKGGISAVVRDTLERGLAAEAPVSADERTGMLLRFVAAAARALNSSFDRPWWQSEVLTEVMRRAVESAIREYGTFPYHYEPIGPGDPGVSLVPNDFDPDWQPEAPRPPRPGSPLDQLLLHPFLRFRELTEELMADALWPLREPLSPYDAPPFPPPPDPKRE